MKINLSELYSAYLQDNNNNQLKSNLNTALFRYTLPGLGFVIPQRSSKRFNINDIQMAVEFASQFILDKDTTKNLIEIQEKILSQTIISQANKRHQRKILRDFMNYSEKFIKQDKPIKEKKLIRQ